MITHAKHYHYSGKYSIFDKSGKMVGKVQEVRCGTIDQSFPTSTLVSEITCEKCLRIFKAEHSYLDNIRLYADILSFKRDVPHRTGCKECKKMIKLRALDMSGLIP